PAAGISSAVPPPEHLRRPAAQPDSSGQAEPHPYSPPAPTAPRRTRFSEPPLKSISSDASSSSLFSLRLRGSVRGQASTMPSGPPLADPSCHATCTTRNL